jgi:ABC-2 type transport system permease protein
LTQKSQKRIAFLSGQGEVTLQEMQAAQQVLAKQYEVTTVDVSKGQPIGGDVAALIVAAPKNEFSEPAKYQIDQYIMRGGKVAFLLNKVDADLQQRFGRELSLKIEDLLENYGLRLNPDLIRDAQCAPISIVQQQAGFSQ